MSKKEGLLMNKRGAYFFVLDAMIASSIIVLSLIIIFTTHTLAPESTPTLRLIEEYTDFMVSTTIREFQGPVRDQLVNNSNITDIDNTIIEQLTEFYYYNITGQRNNGPIMWDFVEEVSKGIIPPQRSVAVYMNNSLIYERAIVPLEEADLALTTKKICFKRINMTYVYGPIIMETKIWI